MSPAPSDLAPESANDLAALIRRHHALVEAVCRRVLGHDAAVDEAMQATWLALARHGADIRQPAARAAWLHRVARRCAVRLARQRQRHWTQHVMLDETLPASASPTAPAAPAVRAQEELLARVDAAVEALPARYRDAIFCAYHLRLDRETGARQLGLSLAGYKTRLARARARLERALVRSGIASAASATACEAWTTSLATGATPPLSESACLALATQTSAPSAAVAALAASAVPRSLSLSFSLLAGAGALTLATLGVLGWRVFEEPPPERVAIEAPTASRSSVHIADAELTRPLAFDPEKPPSSNSSPVIETRPSLAPLPYVWPCKIKMEGNQPYPRIQLLDVRGSTPAWQPGASLQVRGRYRPEFEGGRIVLTLSSQEVVDCNTACFPTSEQTLTSREGEFILEVPLLSRSTPHLFFYDADGNYQGGLYLGDDTWLNQSDSALNQANSADNPLPEETRQQLNTLKGRADNGDRDAARDLALRYAEGSGGLVHDASRAYRWFLIAGESDAAARIASLLTPEQRAEESGFAAAYRELQTAAR